MSDPRASSNDGDKHSDYSKEAAVAKTTGFLVFSGIAMSILKTLNPFNKDRNATPLPQQPVPESTHSSLTQPIRDSPPTPLPQQPVAESTHSSLTQPIGDSPPPPPPPEPIITKKSSSYTEQRVPECSEREIEIVKGDTLWGLSRKYGVSIDTIKEANGLTGDTIYAGKKLIIP